MHIRSATNRRTARRITNERHTLSCFAVPFHVPCLRTPGERGGEHAVRVAANAIDRIGRALLAGLQFALGAVAVSAWGLLVRGYMSERCWFRRRINAIILVGTGYVYNLSLKLK